MRSLTDRWWVLLFTAFIALIATGTIDLDAFEVGDCRTQQDTQDDAPHCVHCCAAHHQAVGSAGPTLPNESRVRFLATLEPHLPRPLIAYSIFHPPTA